MASISDPRFAKVHSDPRFMRMPKKEVRHVIDDRFKFVEEDAELRVRDKRVAVSIQTAVPS